MAEPRLDFVTCVSPAGFHRMAYWEWGNPDNPDVLLCVHGLTRNGRDFDALARQLSGRYRVICPDVVGRGQSDWLINPLYYTIPQYASDMMTLLARLRPGSLSWVGTSMGGLIGLALAGALDVARKTQAMQAHVGLPSSGDLAFERLVLNDVGPTLELAALTRIGQRVGVPLVFDTFEQAVAATKEACATFGPHSEAQWRELTQHSYLHLGMHWVKRYDVKIAMAFAAQADPQAFEAGEALLWRAYEGLKCPVLVVRGAESDLLSRQTVERMRQAHLRTEVVEFAGVGHAPTLMTPEQIAPIAQFLQVNPAPLQ